MSEWQEYKFSDFVEINPTGNTKNNEMYSFIEMTDLNPNYKYVEPKRKRNAKGLTKFRNGDSLFAKITPCLENGKICQARGLETDIGVGSTEFIIFRGREKISFSDFVYYLLKYYQVKNYAIKNMTGTAGQQRVPINVFENLFLKLPNFNEQARIAKALSIFDTKIDLLRRQNETLEKIAQTLFKQWFVDFEFPDEAGKPYKSSGGSMQPSELGDIPQGWKEIPIFELGSFINGAAFKPSELNDKKEGVPVIKIVELKYGITDRTKWSEKKISKDIVIKDKEVLFSWSGSPETSIDIFVWSGGTGKLNQHTFKVIPKSDIELSWLFFLLKHLKPFFIHLAKQKQTTGLGHVTITDLKDNKVVTPSPQIMSYFSEEASPLFDKMFSNSIQIKILTKIRDGLLPKLMSGKIRVNE
jgi:type I restriction enzyme S subunit